MTNPHENETDPREEAVCTVVCSREENENKKIVSITEAARIHNVTRQAIYVAIKQKKLKAKKETTRWTIDLDDLETYRSNKYNRALSMHNGELLFDNSKGYYSVKQTAKLLNVPDQKIYYATRVGQLKAERRGAAWVIHIDSIENYRKAHLESAKQPQQAV